MCVPLPTKLIYQQSKFCVCVCAMIFAPMVFCLSVFLSRQDQTCEISGVRRPVVEAWLAHDLRARIILIRTNRFARKSLFSKVRPLFVRIGCGSPMLWCFAPSVASKIRKLRLIGKWNRKIGKSDFPSLYRVSKSRVCLICKIQVPRCWFSESYTGKIPASKNQKGLHFWFSDFLNFWFLSLGQRKTHFPKHWGPSTNRGQPRHSRFYPQSVRRIMSREWSGRNGVKRGYSQEMVTRATPTDPRKLFMIRVKSTNDSRE